MNRDLIDRDDLIRVLSGLFFGLDEGRMGDSLKVTLRAIHYVINMQKSIASVTPEEIEQYCNGKTEEETAPIRRMAEELWGKTR